MDAKPGRRLRPEREIELAWSGSANTAQESTTQLYSETHVVNEAKLVSKLTVAEKSQLET